MTSQLKSDTARANGAKSRGPKSAATREISSRNSLRHGFSACNTILLACECREDFDKMLVDYNAMFNPATLEENSLVREMVAARWRMQRMWTAEVSVIDVEMIEQEPAVAAKFAAADAGVLLGVSLRSLADESRCLSLISRYESRLHRIHERCRRTLRELQKERKSESAQPLSANLPNDTPEPKPQASATSIADPKPMKNNPPATMRPHHKIFQNEPKPRRLSTSFRRHIEWQKRRSALNST